MVGRRNDALAVLETERRKEKWKNKGSARDVRTELRFTFKDAIASYDKFPLTGSERKPRPNVEKRTQNFDSRREVWSQRFDLRDRASAIEFNVYPNFSASNICLRGTTGSSFDTFREQREHVWFKINIVRFVDRDSIFESRLNNKGNFHCYFLVSEITKIIGTQSGFHFGNQVKEYKNINVYTNFFHLYIPN